ncbi:MAG: PAS domain S-box protein, partial [Poseidonibacter sp.]|uniref:PAS domain S-box protein n=1 Tax=Poseidonibacter sp. TaxID=2321188 RepID=UPI00359E4881
SLKPLNPSNKADEFEKEALNYFKENKDKEFYVKTDTNKDLYNFMGKLIVEQSCLQCHAIQGYKLGEVKGGIRVSIPMETYKQNFEDVEFHYKTQIYISILFAVIIFFIFLLIINKLFKNQENLQNLKDKYKILYDRYDYAVSGSKLGLWDWNLQTNKIYFSKQWKEMLGYKEDELSNSFETWDEKVHPDDKEKARFDISQNQKHSTEYYENIHRLKHKNGTWVWILDKGKTIFDENGNAVRMVGFHTDITKIQELKKEISKLKKVIEHSPISIVITDVDGIIEYVNPCFCKTTGYSYKEALGSNPRVLKSEYTSSFEYQNLWNTLLSKKTWRGRFKNKRKDGSEFWESAIITPIFDEQNEIVNFLAIKQEITKEIYLKEEIKNKEEMMIAQSRHA